MSKPEADKANLLKAFREAAFSEKTALAISTWFGSGLFPFAPGTFGTLMTIPLVLILGHVGIGYRFVVLSGLICAGVWSSGKTQDILGKKDPSEVVIDETAGFVLATLWLPLSWKAIGLSFFLFRFFDVVKPYPIRKLERLKGGVGIVADDLLAGAYAYVAALVILFFLPSST